MSDKLKSFLQKNRQLVVEENFSELLQKCPIELRDELRELYGEFEAEFDRKLDPEMYVAWWFAGDKTSISAYDLKVTRLKDAPVTEETPYLFVVTEYEKIPNVVHVVKFEGNYYVLDSDIRKKITYARSKKLAAERKAHNATTGKDVFNKVLNNVKKEIEGIIVNNFKIAYDGKHGDTFAFNCHCTVVKRRLVGISYNYSTRKTLVGECRWTRSRYGEYYIFIDEPLEVETTEQAIKDAIFDFCN